MTEFLMGLDLGQSSDYTALSVLEKIDIDSDRGMVHGYHLRHLERPKLGTPYPAIVERAKKLLSRDPLKGASSLIVDATGVGAPVVDMMRQADIGAPIIAVTITGGDTVGNASYNTYRVPKRDLVSNLQVLFQSGRLKVAQGLPEASLLVKELLTFQVKITLDAHDTYGAWREGAHDDLVLSVALAVWYGERQPPMPFQWIKDGPSESVNWPD